MNAVVMITRKCNMSCAHCSVESHPGISTEPTAEELRRTVMELGEAGVKGIQFTGGEPFIRHELLFELMELASSRGICSAMVTNGFWGKKPERAEEFFYKLMDLGLGRLTISYDRFHAKFLGPQAVRNILEVARKNFFPVNINITRTKDDSELSELLEPFREYENVAFRFYDVQPVGLAAKLDEELRGQLDGFCSGCEQPTVTDNGRMVACNGPSYFEPDDSALVLGKTADTSLQKMLQWHAEDPILETIRLEGPLKLKQTLHALPEFRDFGFKKHYSGMCELCRHICQDKNAVQALRRELSKPDKIALRLAQQQVKCAAREEVWHREAINAVVARRVLFLALSRHPEQHTGEVRQILSRADVDWIRQAEMLSRNGLLGSLKERRHLLEEFAPDVFWELVEQAEVSADQSMVTLNQALSRWQASDFEDLLALAMTFEQSETLSASLLSSSSPLATLARRLLHRNGLWLQQAPAETRGWFARLREMMGQAVVAAQPYRHFNFFVKPAAHLLCTDGLADFGGNLQRAFKAFWAGLSQCAGLRGWKETLRLLAKDLARVNRVLSLNPPGATNSEVRATQDRADRECQRVPTRCHASTGCVEDHLVATKEKR